MSAGSFFRASVRRELELPPIWAGRKGDKTCHPLGVAVPVDWPDAPLPIEIEDAETGGMARSAISPVDHTGMPDAGTQTADDASGCEGPEAAVTSGAASGDACFDPANSGQSRTRPRVTKPVTPRPDPVPVEARISLAGVQSEMDRRAQLAVDRANAACGVMPPVSEGLVPCRCGNRGAGTGPGLVPAWFGRDCIEGTCPLKVPA